MSLDPGHNAAATHGILSRLNTLSSDVDSLQYTLNSVKSDVEDLRDVPDDIDQLRHRINDAEEEISRTESRLSDKLGDTERLLKRLLTRAEWLERHTRQNPDTETIDFDDTTEETRKLVRAVALGLNAEASLLTAPRRALLQNAINRLETARTQRNTHRQTILTAAEILSTTTPDEPQHRQAAKNVTAAVPQLQRIIDGLPKLIQDATEARTALAGDDASRRAQAATIEAGQKAAKKLRWRMRSRLADAISRQVMLPTWFITVLGPLPPAAETEEWMNTATEVLIYRVTYKVTDPVVALGEEPANPQSRRYHRYQSLRDDLRRWDT
jgi:chromosome segregation ATPase